MCAHGVLLSQQPSLASTGSSSVHILSYLPLALHYCPEPRLSNARFTTASLVCITDGRSHQMQGLGVTFYPCRGTEQTGPFTQLPASEGWWQDSVGHMREKLSAAKIHFPPRNPLINPWWLCWLKGRCPPELPSRLGKSNSESVCTREKGIHTDKLAPQH